MQVLWCQQNDGCVETMRTNIASQKFEAETQSLSLQKVLVLEATKVPAWCTKVAKCAHPGLRNQHALHEILHRCHQRHHGALLGRGHPCIRHAR